jgi:hypothetical protein
MNKSDQPAFHHGLRTELRNFESEVQSKVRLSLKGHFVEYIVEFILIAKYLTTDTVISGGCK